MYITEMTDKDIKAMILDALLKIRNDPEIVKSNEFGGICFHVEEITGYQCDDYLRDVFSGWPRHSGDPVFPVPGVNYRSASTEFMNSNNVWDMDTEYGRARWELLEWSINELQEEMK